MGFASSFHMLERDSILKRFSFSLGPTDVGDSLASDSDHGVSFALNLSLIDNEKDRHILSIAVGGSALRAVAP